MAAESHLNLMPNRPYNSNPTEYVSSVLKPQFGNSEEFLTFERHFYYQTQELQTVKNACDELRSLLSKKQEEKRSLELQLVSEKAAREQESKAAALEMDKMNVQQNAQIYTIKCEVESWKRKTEAITAECNCLKEQMKTVEMEKNQALQNLTALKTKMKEFERCRQSFESYTRRLWESITNANRKLEEVEKAKESLTKLVDSNQQQVDKMSLHLQNWDEERRASHKRITELENELTESKAALVQNNAKLARADLVKQKAVKVVDKLQEENEDLHNGLKILTKSFTEQIQDTDRQLLDKLVSFRKHIDISIKKLHLNEANFSPLTSQAC